MSDLVSPIYPVFKTAVPLDIDGRLDEPIWNQLPTSTAFVDIEANPDRLPNQDTRFMVAWDQSHVYVAMQMDETDLWGTMTEKNSVLYHENDIELFLDPDGDYHNYHEIEWNVLGTIWELSLDRPYRDSGPLRDPNNMPGLKYAVAINGTANKPGDTDQGWSVEVAIPWNDMRAFDASPLPPVHGTTWRANFSRVQWPLEVDSTGAYRKKPEERENNQVWSPTGLVDMHRPERWGWWIFLDSESPWTSIETDLLNDVKRRQSIQNRLMAIYYYAAHYRGKMSDWPGESSLKNRLISAGRCATYDRTRDGYRATAWACPDGPISLKRSNTAYSIDHLGHMERLK